MLMAETTPFPSNEFLNKSFKTKPRLSIKDVFKFVTKWHPNTNKKKKLKSISKLNNKHEVPERNKGDIVLEENPTVDPALGRLKEEPTQEQEQMNGLQDFMYNSSQKMRNANEQTSPKGGFFKHKSMDNYFTSNIPSFLSRTASKRSQTPTPQQTQPSPFSLNSNTRSSEGDDFLSRSVSRRSSTPIMFSNSNGLIKPPVVEKKLECTLEELCFGCVKKIKVTRDVVTNTGQIVEEEEILTIKVKPGWKKGTKITFEGMGNERPGTYPADITFLIAEKRHPIFEREGDDLELAVEIPLVKALTGCTLSVPILGGEKMTINIDDIIYPGYVKKIAGQGMAISKEEGRRGSLKIVFLVEFPLDLTDEQREEAYDILQ